MSFRDLPVWFVFLTIIIIVPILAVIGLVLFKTIDISKLKCTLLNSHNAIVAIFIGISASFLGILISFLVVTTWNIAKQAQLDSQQEAQNLLVLYQTVYSLPNTEEIKLLIVTYIEYIINVEYPQLKNGSITLFGSQLLGKLQASIYNYKAPSDGGALYSNAIQELNNIVQLRVDRIHNATAGVPPILWAACILDSIIVIFITYFLTCDSKGHYILVYIVSTLISALLAVIYIFNYPFKGSSGLKPTPFEEALVAIKNYDGVQNVG